jgi:hypothetical protein
MRSCPASHVVTFLTPPGAWIEPGFRIDSPHGCILEVGRTGLVTILGPSREAVFELAARLLRAACRGRPPASVSARLYQPRPNGELSEGRDWLELPGPVDGWTIIIGAEVAFSPTPIDPHIPDLSRRGPALVAAQRPGGA